MTEIFAIISTRWFDITNKKIKDAIYEIWTRQKISWTFLQRRLNISFAEWAEIMFILEELWLIWSQTGAAEREIFIRDPYWEDD